MATICEHNFNMPDFQDATKSHSEFDLAAKLNLTIVKNIEENRFEIRDIKTGTPQYHGDLQHVVRVANELEGESFIEVACSHK